MKDVPTFAEQGEPELTTRVWFGLLIKNGTPPNIVSRLTDAAKAAHADPAVRAKLEAQGYEVTGETGPQLMPEAQTARWARIVKAAGFSAEDRGNTR
jgi:tripartite-type tricarboxylate transporter receptor subunit TctC